MRIALTANILVLILLCCISPIKAQVGFDLTLEKSSSFAQSRLNTESWISTNKKYTRSAFGENQDVNIRNQNYSNITIEPGLIIPSQHSGHPLIFGVFGFNNTSGEMEFSFYDWVGSGIDSPYEVLEKKWVRFETSSFRFGFGGGYMLRMKGNILSIVKGRLTWCFSNFERNSVSIEDLNNDEYSYTRKDAYSSDGGFGMGLDLEIGLRYLFGEYYSPQNPIRGLIIGASIKASFGSVGYRDDDRRDSGRLPIATYSYLPVCLNINIGYFFSKHIGKVNQSHSHKIYDY